jgi:hypothetical protein
MGITTNKRRATIICGLPIVLLFAGVSLCSSAKRENTTLIPDLLPKSEYQAAVNVSEQTAIRQKLALRTIDQIIAKAQIEGDPDKDGKLRVSLQDLNLLRNHVLKCR